MSLSVDNQQAPLLEIYKVGSDIFEIEKICELPKIKFFDTVFHVKKIRDRNSHTGFKTFLGAVITKISVLAGIKNEIDQLTKQDLIKMLTTAYGDISLEEVYKAFEMERYGVYETRSEHFQLFSTEYVSEVLKKYKAWKMKEKKLLNYYPPKGNKENNEVTEEEKLKIRNEFLKIVFEEIKENGFYKDAWLLYDDIEKSGKINISVEEKKKLYSEELAKYKPQKIEEIRSKATYSANHLLKDFQNRLVSGKPLVSVQNTCKSILVCKYIKDNLKDFEKKINVFNKKQNDKILEKNIRHM